MTSEKPKLRHLCGFSLLEALTAVLIIGVLAVTAIPQFAAQADLRNAAAAEEAYFAQHQVYKAGPLPNVSLPGYNKSLDVSGMDTIVGTNTYILIATHSNCAGITCTYTNSTGIPYGPPCP